MIIYWFFFEETWIHFTQGCFVLRLLKLAQWFWRRGFFYFVNVFLLFRNYLPLEKGGPFIWTNLNPLHPRMLWAKFGRNCPVVLGKNFFFISSMYFRHFVIISPWKRAGPFIWTNLNPLHPWRNLNTLHPRIHCAKFGWKWPSGSGEEDENVKSLQTDRQTDGQTDGRIDRRRTTGDQKSSLELSAQVS